MPGKDPWQLHNYHQAVKTIYQFIIIVSTVRSNKQYKEERGKKIPIDNNKYPFALGFARELQRINVGFSRAKRLLIVVGNEKHFSHKPEYQQAIQKMHRIDIAQIQNLIK